MQKVVIMDLGSTQRSLCTCPTLGFSEAWNSPGLYVGSPRSSPRGDSSVAGSSRIPSSNTRDAGGGKAVTMRMETSRAEPLVGAVLSLTPTHLLQQGGNCPAAQRSRQVEVQACP